MRPIALHTVGLIGISIIGISISTHITPVQSLVDSLINIIIAYVLLKSIRDQFLTLQFAYVIWSESRGNLLIE